MTISADVAINTILEGAKDASEAYQNLSGGYWIDYAPESFLQGGIAMAFDRLKRNGATFNLMLEMSPKRLYEEFGVKPDGRSVKMRENQRFDILILDKSCAPRFPIEIKKAQSIHSCTKDAKRISQWISDAKGKVKCGFIVAYTCQKGKDSEGKQAQKRITEIFEGIKEQTKATRYMPIAPKEIDHNGWMWDVACFIIE